MILFAVEEFAARRRTTQRDIEDRLRPVVAHAVDLMEDTHGWNELLAEVADIYTSQVFEESGLRYHRLPGNARQDILRTLRKTTAPRTDATVERITMWLSTTVLSLATLTATQQDPEELFLEWVDMHDSDVRPAHREANGQVRPLGEKFKVGGAEMRYPGDTTVDIALWINCRCTLHPVLAEEALVASTDPMAERPGLGGYPINDCSDLKNAIQAIGRARPEDRAKTIAHIKTQKKNLGCPDVTLPEDWAQGDTMPPTKKKPGDMIEEPTDEEFPPEPDDTEEEDPKKKPEELSTGKSDGPVPWHAVFAPEDIWSGDKRKFAEGALSNRPLPLPLTWQKVSAAGHDGNVTVAKTERIGKVKHPTEGHYEQRAAGHFIMNTEADEVVGLIGEFGKFGLSVDADDTTYELDEDEEGVVYSLSRTCSACIVPIPAFHQAWIMLGDPPVDFFDGADDYQAVGMDEPMAPTDAGGADPEEALVASAVFDLASLFTMPLVEVFKDLAPGRTEDGPGWLTHPVDTDRLRDYWVRGPGAAKIGWGTPGDFNRCRLQVAKYVKPQYLAGYCANRHFDALGFWPGRPVAADAVPFAADTMELEGTDPAPALNLVASVAHTAPAAWFSDPGFTPGDPRLVQAKDGTWGCPVTVTDEGEVYGHIAKWGVCHIAYSGECVTAPHSATNYAHFLGGAVHLDDGTVACTGPITVGGGHADEHMSMQMAKAYYDSTSTVAADVAAGDDQFGIWCHGWIRPGTSKDMATALRASVLSGDWRQPSPGSPLQELIVAHAVNAGGFNTPRVRIAAGSQGQISLVAAGAVPQREEHFVKGADLDRLVASLADEVADELEGRRQRREAMLALAARVNFPVESEA